MTIKFPISLLVSLIVLGTLHSGMGASIRGLFEGEDLKPSEAHGVSGDGTRVVGWGTIYERQAYYWNAGEGEFLPVSGARESVAYDISDDGTVIVGWIKGTVGNMQATMWTANGTNMSVIIPSLSSSDRSSLFTAISGDGAVGGGYYTGGSTGLGSAFRWTSSNGVEEIGNVEDWQETYITSLSSDGTTFVGHGTFNDQKVALTWTEDEGFTPFFALEGYTDLTFTNISNDGSVIIGTMGSPGVSRPIMWTEESGIVLLDETRAGEVTGINADGTIIVGTFSNSEASIWTEADGMRSLADVLTLDYGVDLGGWTLLSARSISADGSTIVGYGWSPQGRWQGWIAVIPEPSVALLFLLGNAVMLFRRERKSRR